MEAATSTCIQLTTLALKPTDIRHRHRHRHHGGMSRKTPPPTELQIPATVTTLHIHTPAITHCTHSTATYNMQMNYTICFKRCLYCININVSQLAWLNEQEAQLPQKDRTIANLCYVSRGMAVRKVSNNESNLQYHSRALAMVPFNLIHSTCLQNLANVASAIPEIQLRASKLKNGSCDTGPPH